MKFVKQWLSLLLCFILLSGLTVPVENEVITVQAETSTRIEQLLESMTLRQKITQMMMVDFRYWDEDLTDSTGKTGFTVMNDQVRKVVEDYDFGAIIYFAQNLIDTQQAYDLTFELQKAAVKDNGIPMIISADQEGGSVYRLATGTALPGNMALGAAGNTVYSEMAGKIISSELASLGINTSLSPVVDVNNNANNPVIGLRSYSDNAEMVGNLAAATIGGMAEYGVIGCAKHFPGHGNTATDSHYGLPVVNQSKEELLTCELKPYEIAIGQGIDMIMTAHILYPQLETDKILSQKTGLAESLPATLSDDIITGLLKNEMGFKGIVTTDAMNMAGISDTWDQVQSVVLAISAGVDMICMPCTLYDWEDLANLDAIIQGVEEAVKDGTIPMSRIDDGVTRILTVKEKNGILDWNEEQASLAKATAMVGSAFNRQVEREIAAAAVTVVQNKNNTLPLAVTDTSKVLMLVPYDNEQAQMIMGWNRAKAAGLIPEGAQVKVVRFSSDSLSAVRSDIDWADTVIVNSEVNSASKLASSHWLYAGPKAFVEYAEGKGKTTVVQSVDKPYDVQMYTAADAVLAVYGCKGSSVDVTEALVGGATTSQAAYGPNIIAGIEVAFGTFGASGTLPVDIPQLTGSTFGSQLVYQRGYGLSYDAKHIHTVTAIRSAAATETFRGYAMDFYECTACGMWFEDENATRQIVDKYSVLGEAEIPPAESVNYGDVNRDKQINAADALQVLKSAVGKAALSPEQKELADVSGEGEINAVDALYILQYAVEKRDSFPVEENE